MMIAVPTTSIAQDVFAEKKYNKDKKACSNYDGEWNKKKGKCEFDKDQAEDKAAYEDYICDDPKEAKHYPKVC